MRAAFGMARADRGFLTVQYLLAIGLTFLLLAHITNLLVAAYGRGAVRAALDEGVRAGSVVDGGPAECVARAQAVLDDLLGGWMGSGVGPVSCAVDGPKVTASAQASFPAWLPGIPPHSFTITAQMVREPDADPVTGGPG